MIVTIGGIPVYEALVTDEATGMFKISLVDDPAVMSNFQAFDNARKPVMYTVQDEDKRLVRGVVMRADFPIYRYDKESGEYYIIYHAEQIRKMAEKYLVDGLQNEVNTMHLNNSDVEGVQMVQFFIKGNGVQIDGFDDIADGSLFAEFHVVNDDIWAEIKAGTYKGFSLEGVFDLAPEQNEDQLKDIVDALQGAFSRIFHNSNTNKMSKFSKFKAGLAKLLQEFGNVTTDKGILAWDGDEDLKEGDAVYIEDAEGNRTDAADGDYTTEDNKTIVVVDGKVSEIKDPEAQVAPAEPEKVEETMGAVNTDKGILSWDGEEPAKVGDAVYIESAEGESVPAPDGEYTTEGDVVFVVKDGVLSEIREANVEPEPQAEPEELAALRKENEALKAQVAELKAQVTKMAKLSGAKPAHEEFKTSAAFAKTGVKGIDNLAKLLSAK